MTLEDRVKRLKKRRDTVRDLQNNEGWQIVQEVLDGVEKQAVRIMKESGDVHKIFAQQGVLYVLDRVKNTIKFESGRGNEEIEAYAKDEQMNYEASTEDERV